MLKVNSSGGFSVSSRMHQLKLQKEASCGRRNEERPSTKPGMGQEQKGLPEPPSSAASDPRVYDTRQTWLAAREMDG